MTLVLDWSCSLCGCDIVLDELGDWRHAREPWQDGSGFCPRYGYPLIDIKLQFPAGESLRTTGGGLLEDPIQVVANKEEAVVTFASGGKDLRLDLRDRNGRAELAFIMGQVTARILMRRMQDKLAAHTQRSFDSLGRLFEERET